MNEHVPHLPPHLEGQSTWLSKATSARFLGHPLVWSGMTAVFIFAGYMWLEYYARPLSDHIDQTHSDSELIGSKTGGKWNPEIYKNTPTEESMTITRRADDLRAENYRQAVSLENEIKPLLVEAGKYMDEEIYTSENQNNAWQSYQRILNIDSNNKLAISGQAQILGMLKSNAEFAMQDGMYEDTELWLAHLDNIQPNAPFQEVMREKVATKISEEVALLKAKQREIQKIELLRNALKDAANSLALSPPELRAAYDLYQRALELDNDNTGAIEGLRKIHLARKKLATEAIIRHDFEQALSQIERLKQIQAKQELVSELEANMVKAQAAILPIEPVSTEPKMLMTEANPAANVAQTIDSKQADTSARKSDENTSILKTPANTGPDTDSSSAAPIPPANREIETVDIVVSISPPKSPIVITNATEPEPTEKSKKIRQLSEGINAYYAGDYNTAFAKLHPLASSNSPRAQFRLGIMYYQGRTVVKNEDLARQWIARALPAILRAAQKGQAWAQADLGTAYELGIGVKESSNNAAEWYRKSADQGYVGGQTNLGVLYGTGAGVKYDRQAALYWLKKAAAQGDKVAQDNLKILNAR